MNFRRLLLPLAVIGLLAFGVLFFLSGPNARRGKEPEQVKTTPVIVAKKAIPQGAEITMNDYEEKPYTDAELANVPPDAILESKALIGGRAKVAILAEDYFTPTNTDPLPPQFSGQIEPGFVAVTFPAPPEPSLYDLKFLNPDDRVDVFGVYLDQGTGDSVSVRLASNVRLLAVDTVRSQAEEDKRIADLDLQIKAANDRKTQMNASTPPPTAEQLAAVDKEITDLGAQKNPEIPEEMQSLTVEVTHDQSQKIALWRQTADITVALHREEDAQQVIFGDMASVEGLPAGEPGAPVTPGLAQGGRILTLDDVVPLDRRDPAKYYSEQQTEEQYRQMIADRRLEALEREASELETQIEIRNLRAHGKRIPPEADLPAPGYVPPGAVYGGPGGGLTKGDLNQALNGVNKRIDALNKKIQSRPAQTSQPKPLRGSIEVYRGKDKTIENY